MDTRVITVVLVWGIVLLIASIALTGLINSFLPSVEKSKLIKRIAVIFSSIIIIGIVILFILSKT